jgi:hypothetical protein
LSDRRAQLFFDGELGSYVNVPTGNPQGCPLAPILSILFLAPLYNRLAIEHPNISVIGFADDTNLLAFGKCDSSTISQLESAWRTCLTWATERGLRFNQEKTELLHFFRGRKNPWQKPIDLANNTVIQPVKKARFLGVWLDTKLN